MEKVEINKQAKLSEHFTLGEMIKTRAKGLDNTPPHGAVINLKNLCENWLEDLRYSYNLLYCLQPGEDYESSKNVEPLIINSGFRSEDVNKAIGGVSGSNHLTGCAVDIKCLGIEQAIRYAAILLDIADGKKQEFDELLIERSPKGTYWLHFAVRPTLRQAQGPENRRKVRFIQT
jgi:uncharacterized protein YcbK (DUF882 family)